MWNVARVPASLCWHDLTCRAIDGQSQLPLEIQHYQLMLDLKEFSYVTPYVQPASLQAGRASAYGQPPYVQPASVHMDNRTV